MFEYLTLFRTGKMDPVPFFIDAVTFEKLLKWMKEVLVPSGMIDEEDMEFMTILEKDDEIDTKIVEFYNAKRNKK